LKAFGGSFHQVNLKLADDTDYNDLKALTNNVILNKLRERPSDKNLQVSVRILYDKIKDDTDIIYKQIFSSDYAVILRTAKNITDFVNEFIETLTNHIVEQESGASNMNFKCFTGLQIQFTYKKLSKVGSYIKLPKVLADKKCCVNIKNTDDKCIKYCFLAFKHYEDVGKKENKNSTKGYVKWDKEFIELDKIEYPINIDKDLPKIEELNDVKIDVFGYDTYTNKPFVVYNDNMKKVEDNKIMDLLLICDETNQHFVYIKNFSRFIGVNGVEKAYCCRNCLNFHSLDKDIYELHCNNCIQNEAVRAVLPTEDEKHMRFKNFNHTFQHPFNIVYDFESKLQKSMIRAKKVRLLNFKNIYRTHMV